MTAVARTRGELAEARSALRGRVAVVMTMGALHAGHASLLRAARSRADSVIVTIFVNPTQFGPGEDFDRYPRTLEDDLAVCSREGVDLVFAPPARVMYPGGEPAVRVDPGPLGEIFEGASRPGFFRGVLTVVAKLLHLTRPDLAFFGEKDYQQLALVSAMVADLDLPVEVVGVPTVREPDGLALSSRNRYLSPVERASALALSRALAAAVAEGPGGAVAALRAASDVLGSDPGVKLDYLALTDPGLRPLAGGGPARLLVAAWAGGTRLIDNVALEIG